MDWHEISGIEHPTLPGMFRIRAGCDNSFAAKGDLGGWVNWTCSVMSDSWVSKDSLVTRSGVVSRGSLVTGKSTILGMVSRSVVKSSAIGGMTSVISSKITNSEIDRAHVELANLDYAKITGPYQYLRLAGLPSGKVELYRTKKSYHFSIGCWSGSIQDLRDLMEDPRNRWPSDPSEEGKEQRRPGLLALADLAEAHMRGFKWHE